MSKSETQYCEYMSGLDVCDREEDGTGTCGDKFDDCIWGRETKDGMNDKRRKQ